MRVLGVLDSTFLRRDGPARAERASKLLARAADLALGFLERPVAFRLPGMVASLRRQRVQPRIA